MILNKRTKKSHINDDYTRAHILYNSKIENVVIAIWMTPYSEI